MLRWLYRISPNVVTRTPPTAIQPLAAWVSECIAFILMFTGSVEWSVYSHVNDPWRMGLSWALSAHMCQVLGRSITIIYIWLQIDQYDRICTAISNLDCTSCDAIGLLWPALPTSENVRGLSLCTDQIRCHLAGDIFYKHLHLQTTNCRVGNRLQDISKTRRDGWKMLEERCRPNDRPLRGHQKVNFVCSAVWNEIERWRQTWERACLWTNMSGKPAITLVAIDTAHKPWFWKQVLASECMCNTHQYAS